MQEIDRYFIKITNSFHYFKYNLKISHTIMDTNKILVGNKSDMD